MSVLHKPWRDKASPEKLTASRVEAVMEYRYEVGCTIGPRTEEESEALALAILDLRRHRVTDDERDGFYLTS